MIRLLAACTDRKKVEPIARARMLPVGDAQERVACWVKLLNAKKATITALDLYQGDHWAVARSLTDHADLWAVSAGYGLIDVMTPVVPYAATFIPKHPDSVTIHSPQQMRSSERQAWWMALRSQKCFERPALEKLCEDASVTIIAASGAYLDAMSQELLEADRNGHPIIIASASPAPPSVEHLRLPASGRLRAVLGGSMQSINIRIARHMLQHIDPNNLSMATASDEIRRLLDAAPPLMRYDRRQIDDQAITEFILQQQRSNPQASHTRLLRELRNAGWACEQQRFRRLFNRTVRGA